MDVSLISVPMAVEGAYSEGGIPLSVHAIANVKVSSDRRFIGNAIERFLGRDRAEIARVVEGDARGPPARRARKMTPEEVNEDRLKFARQLGEEAEADLEKLGLQLDTLKIQHVADDRNYLDCIGRKRIAEVLRTAEVAESDAMRAARGGRGRGQGARRGREDQRAGQRPAQAERAAPDQGRARRRGAQRGGARDGRGPAGARRGRAASCSRSAASSSSSGSRPTSPSRPRSTRRSASWTRPARPRRSPPTARRWPRSLAAVADAWRESGGKRDGHVRPAAPRRDLRARSRPRPRTLKVGEVNLIDAGDGKTLPAYVGAVPGHGQRAARARCRSTLGIDIAQGHDRRSSTTGRLGGPEASRGAPCIDRRSAIAVLAASSSSRSSSSRIIYICAPNEVLIFSGAHRKRRRRAHGRLPPRPGRPRHAHPADRGGRPHGPDQHDHRPPRARAPTPRAASRSTSRASRTSRSPAASRARQRDRALPGQEARGDHEGRPRDARGQPARRARHADARGGQPGPREVRRASCCTRPTRTCTSSAWSSTR